MNDEQSRTNDDVKQRLYVWVQGMAAWHEKKSDDSDDTEASECAWALIELRDHIETLPASDARFGNLLNVVDYPDNFLLSGETANKVLGGYCYGQKVHDPDGFLTDLVDFIVKGD